MRSSRTSGCACLWSPLSWRPSVFAQQPAMVRVRGTIENVTGPILDVKTRDGAMVKVKLADNAAVGDGREKVARRH